MDVQVIQHQEMTMRYICFGDPAGQPFVIIPGVAVRSVMESAGMIEKQYRRFAERFHVYVFDRREDLPEPYGISRMAEDTARAMEALSIRDAALYGVSQGGMIAQLIAARYPALVRRLALCSTAPVITEKAAAVLAEWRRLAAEKKTPELMLSFAENVYSPTYAERYRAAFLTFAELVTDEDLQRFLRMVNGMEQLDLREEIAGIGCPVLVIGAGKDRIFDVASAEEIARITGGEVCIYPDAAHGVYDEEAGVLEKLLRFLEA